MIDYIKKVLKTTDKTTKTLAISDYMAIKDIVLSLNNSYKEGIVGYFQSLIQKERDRMEHMDNQEWEQAKIKIRLLKESSSVFSIKNDK